MRRSLDEEEAIIYEGKPMETKIEAVAKTRVTMATTPPTPTMATPTTMATMALLAATPEVNVASKRLRLPTFMASWRKAKMPASEREEKSERKIKREREKRLFYVW